MLRRFATWHQPIDQVVTATNPADVLRHDVYDLHPHPLTYSHGRLLLLGDAAHAMTPDLGQGACQALEDAATLHVVAQPGVELDVALTRYDALHRPRARLIATRSRQLGRLGQLHGSGTTRVRDLLLRSTPAHLTESQLASTLTWQPPPHLLSQEPAGE